MALFTSVSPSHHGLFLPPRSLLPTFKNKARTHAHTAHLGAQLVDEVLELGVVERRAADLAGAALPEELLLLLPLPLLLPGAAAADEEQRCM